MNPTILKADLPGIYARVFFRKLPESAKAEEPAFDTQLRPTSDRNMGMVCNSAFAAIRGWMLLRLLSATSGLSKVVFKADFRDDSYIPSSMFVNKLIKGYDIQLKDFFYILVWHSFTW